MRVLPQDPLRRANSTREASKTSNDVHNKRFQDLLKISAVDDHPRDKNFFSILEEEEKESDASTAPFVSILLPLQGAVSPSSAIGTMGLSVDIEALFEKLASCMLVMHSTHEVETTLFLDNPSSVFFGARITIREFSTAPKVFNVEIAAMPQAISVIDASKSDLLAAFQHGKFNFSIHRLDTEIQSHQERPVFCRKENSDQDPQEQKKDRHS